MVIHQCSHCEHAATLQRQIKCYFMKPEILINISTSLMLYVEFTDWFVFSLVNLAVFFKFSIETALCKTKIPLKERLMTLSDNNDSNAFKKIIFLQTDNLGKVLTNFTPY